MEIELVEIDESDSSESEEEMSFDDHFETTEISLSSDVDSSQMEDEEDLTSSSSNSDADSMQEADEGFSKSTDLTNQWFSLPSMNTPRYRFASSMLNGKIYVFGGSTNSHRLNSAEMYNPDTNTWIELKDMKYARSGCSSVVVGHNIYVLGGFDTLSVLRSGEIFNTITMTWSSLPSEMRYKKERHQSVAIGNKIYAFGGYDSLGRGEVFDIDTGYWSIMEPMKTRRYLFDAVAIEGQIYAIGGMMEPRDCPKNDSDQYSRYLETMEVYDTSTDTWKISSQKMSNRRSGCSVFARGSKITVLGGCDEKLFVQAIETFDVLSQRWSGSAIPPFCQERKEFAAFLREDDLIIIGGSATQKISGRASLSSVEIFGDASLLIDKVDMPIPDDNKRTNIHSRRKAKIITPTKSSNKAAIAKHSKAQQQRHKSKRLPQKRSKPNSKKKQNRQRTPKKMKPQPLLTQYAHRRVAKRFGKVIFFGTVSPKVSDTPLLVTVEYDDGDHEELDAQELEDALKLYEKEEIHDRRTKKKGGEKAKKTMGKKSGCVVVPLKQGPTLLEDRLQSIEQLLSERIQKVTEMEEMVFGISQDGSLQARILKLEESLGASLSV
jgi:hypothetical protein